MIIVKQIVLRERTHEKMAMIFEAPRNEQMMFFGVENEVALNRELSRIEHGQYSNYYAGIYFDLLLLGSHEVIGSAGFHTWWRDHDRAELGYWINNEIHRRKGYLDEVLPYLLNYGFNKMKLHRIEAHTAIDNFASISLLKKYGFQFEATIHGRYKMPNGSYDDDSLFYLLNT